MKKDPKLLLMIAIRYTKDLWEVYKTEAIRLHLEYLKDLYNREVDKEINDALGFDTKSSH